MGKSVEEIALSRGYSISAIIDSQSDWDRLDKDIEGTVIDFSSPEAAYNNIMNAFDRSLPVVCGTTGWYSEVEKVRERCSEEGNAIVISSNFSIGVNILFALNNKLASLMNTFPEYWPSISEKHHFRKKDAPSGTAISLAEDIIRNQKRIRSWNNGQEDKEDELPVHSVREGEITGMHEIIWTSSNDRISLHHEAFNRMGFASGAVAAAVWLQNRTGFFTMQDVLGL